MLFCIAIPCFAEVPNGYKPLNSSEDNGYYSEFYIDTSVTFSDNYFINNPDTRLYIINTSNVDLQYEILIYIDDNDKKIRFRYGKTIENYEDDIPLWEERTQWNQNALNKFYSIVNDKGGIYLNEKENVENVFTYGKLPPKEPETKPALIETISILTAGITTLAGGIGSGLAVLAKSIFITEAANGAMSLSTFGATIIIFAGLALAISLSKLITEWISKLGGD